MAEIPIDQPGGDATTKEGIQVEEQVHQQNLTRIGASGAQAHEHFVTFSKVLDYSYEQGRKLTSLVESLGVREVTSQSGHEGIPVAGQNRGR